MNPEKTALLEERIMLEQRWAYERRIVDALAWRQIRSLAVRPRDAGGLGRDVPISTLKAHVAAYRAAQGDVVGTREERIERRQLEIDEIALAARRAMARADRVGALDVHAAKTLLEARAQEAKMHGDDTPTELVVTHRDAVLDDLNAALLAMGEQPVRIES